MPSQTFSLSFRNLPSDLAAQVRKLHCLDRRWNLILILYPLVWALTASAMSYIGTWWSIALGVVIIGICIQAMAILMHEALHNNLFRHPPLDRWSTRLLAIPAGFSGTAYRVAHINHHRHTRTQFDQDEIGNYCKSQFHYRVLFYAWFLFGTIFYMLIVPWKALKIANYVDRRAIIFEYIVMLAVYCVVIFMAYRFGRLFDVLYFWIFPIQVAILFSNVRALAEHHGTGLETVISRSRTTRSNRFVSFLMCNLNYHLEHHLFPGVPWYNLPRLHAVLEPLYRENSAAIERSYTGYAMRSLLHGPGAWRDLTRRPAN
jgi:fatty acid desaturase